MILTKLHRMRAAFAATISQTAHRPLGCLILAALLAISVSLPGLARAQDWAALDSPTAIILMRHALAPGTGDPANFALGDCATQRNLDARGRVQATRIGEDLRARGIDVAEIWTSQWCRCRETADLLALAPIRDMPPLNSFFRNRSQGPAQSAALLQDLARWQGGRLILVTHQVNITALTDIFPASGEMIVTEYRDGRLDVTGRVEIAP
ncbi:MAG: histidine phosphatase family protein [Pseudomonadota bacterium]